MVSLYVKVIGFFFFFWGGVLSETHTMVRELDYNTKVYYELYSKQMISRIKPQKCIELALTKSRLLFKNMTVSKRQIF